MGEPNFRSSAAWYGPTAAVLREQTILESLKLDRLVGFTPVASCNHLGSLVTTAGCVIRRPFASTLEAANIELLSCNSRKSGMSSYQQRRCVGEDPPAFGSHNGGIR